MRPGSHQNPEQSLYAQQLEEHRLKMQREAEMAREGESQPHREAAPEPVIHAPAPRMEEHVHHEATPQVKAPRWKRKSRRAGSADAPP